MPSTSPNVTRQLYFSSNKPPSFHQTGNWCLVSKEIMIQICVACVKYPHTHTHSVCTWNVVFNFRIWHSIAIHSIIYRGNCLWISIRETNYGLVTTFSAIFDGSHCFKRLLVTHRQSGVISTKASVSSMRPNHYDMEIICSVSSYQCTFQARLLPRCFQETACGPDTYHSIWYIGN